MSSFDLQTATVKPYEADEPHRRLARLVGRWKGTTKTMVGPDAPAVEDPWEGEVTSLLGGRFVRFTYQSAFEGKPTAGELTFAFESMEKLWRIGWMDSFHTGTALLSSVGPATDGPVDVKTTYFAAEGHPHWGWRTELHDAAVDEGTFVIKMYNATPDGEEALGVEVTLRRVS